MEDPKNDPPGYDDKPDFNNRQTILILIGVVAVLSVLAFIFL